MTDEECVTISISGMVCISCVNSIESVISEREGVHNIKVNLEKEEAIVTFSKQVTNIKDICESIEDMGFDASVSTGNNITDYNH